jgi:hypothetical protein
MKISSVLAELFYADRRTDGRTDRQTERSILLNRLKMKPYFTRLQEPTVGDPVGRSITSNFLRNQPSNFEGATHRQTDRQTVRQDVNITHHYVHIKPLQRKAFQHTRENSAQLNGISLAERHTKIIPLLHPQYCNRMNNI